MYARFPSHDTSDRFCREHGELPIFSVLAAVTTSVLSLVRARAEDQDGGIGAKPEEPGSGGYEKPV